MQPSRIAKDPATLLAKIKVLVIESDDKVRSLLTSVLNKLGFSDVIACKDGFEAVDLVRKHKPDLIVTDWEIRPADESKLELIEPNSVVRLEAWDPTPPIDGACFVKFIRGSKYSPNPYLSIIMLTSHAVRDHIEYARDAGVNEILLKPVAAESLCARIMRVIDHQRPFITSEHYKGPCRRRDKQQWQGQERRVHDVKIIKHERSYA